MAGAAEQHDRRHRDPGDHPGLQPVRSERPGRQERDARDRRRDRASQARQNDPKTKWLKRRGIPSIWTSAEGGHKCQEEPCPTRPIPPAARYGRLSVPRSGRAAPGFRHHQRDHARVLSQRCLRAPRKRRGCRDCSAASRRARCSSDAPMPRCGADDALRKTEMAAAEGDVGHDQAGSSRQNTAAVMPSKTCTTTSKYGSRHVANSRPRLASAPKPSSSSGRRPHRCAMRPTEGDGSATIASAR